MNALNLRPLGAGLLLALALLPLVSMAEAPTKARDVLHLLDYIAVDYAEAVRDGEVINSDEYREMREFAVQVSQRIATLPAHAEQSFLEEDARRLVQAVESRAPASQVAERSRSLALAVIKAYDIQVTPSRTPDLAQAKALYSSKCASCHGAAGHGDGPAASELTPAPTDFHDRERAQQRSVYALYSTITRGVEGTAMPSFSGLKEQQRWALAFHVSGLSAKAELIEKGRELVSKGVPAYLDSLKGLVSATPEQIHQAYGKAGVAALAYLRSHPQAVTEAPSSSSSPLAVAIRKLDASLAAYRSDRTQQAYRQAVDAYLEGFELVEPNLSARDSGLKTRIEQGMTSYRELIQRGAPLDRVVAKHRDLSHLLDQAQQRLAEGRLAPATTFISAFVILLREGMEAILVLAAIFASLARAGRRDVAPYIHAGWVGALLLGLATWFVADRLIHISGASREVTEGVVALLAVAFLIYVGYWLHDKTHAERWQRFIRHKLEGALSRGTIGGFVAISFLAVYREAFETVLFYQTLWQQSLAGGEMYLLSGAGAGTLLLLGLAWGIFRFSLRLPLALFFRVNSLILFLLALVFAGKGVAALQEAGQLPTHSIAFPAIEWLGVYPNLQSLGLQLALVLAATSWLLYQYLRERRVAPSGY